MRLVRNVSTLHVFGLKMGNLMVCLRHSRCKMKKAVLDVSYKRSAKSGNTLDRAARFLTQNVW